MNRILGVDVGKRRVGIALSDGLGLAATPHSVAAREEAMTALTRLVSEHRVEKVIVGLPTLLSGDEGESARDARNFGDALQRLTGVEVVFRDERFTSRIAESTLLESGMRRRKRRATVDKAAAAIILQDYLDSQR